MTHRRLGSRPARLAAVTVVLCGVLSGCGGQAEVASSAPEPTSESSVLADPTATPSAAPMTRRAARSAAPDEEASLPPGDPGLDAQSVPDPGTAGADAHAHGEARRTVPAAALLTARDVRMMVGGRGWERRAGGGDECVAPEGALASRTMAYGGTPAGTVVETVATYADADASDGAVLAVREALEDCGWIGIYDPRFGSAAVSGDDSGRSLTAVSVEGALVMLVGSGALPRDTALWSSLVDLAVGSSCPAAPDGCH